MDLPKRTGRTSLSDAELLIFDLAFDGGAPYSLLTQEAYPLHMNVDYTHDLSDAELRTMLGSLVQSGLMSLTTEPVRGELMDFFGYL